MARVTVIDVAKHAGVSKSTVSLVLNHSDRVNPATAQRVRDAIRELNYVPSRAARMLQSGRSRQIGIIVSDITNPYFAELVRSVTVAAAVYDLDVVTLDTDYRADLLPAHLDRLLQYQADGILVFTTERNLDVVETLGRNPTAAVLLNWGLSPDHLSQLTVDYLPGLMALVDHLVAHGHRQLAFACGPADFYSANLKKEAFVAACARHQPQMAPPLLLESDARLSLEMGRRLVEQWRAMDVTTRPTAVVVNNDVMALSLLRAFQMCGIHVPGQVSVAGIDDIDAAAYVTPSLTTIRQPRRAMGKLALEMLVDQMKTDVPCGREERLPVRLILRESTGPAPAVDDSAR